MMNLYERLMEQLQEKNPEALTADGLESAVVAISLGQPCRPVLVIYSSRRCLDALADDFDGAFVEDQGVEPSDDDMTPYDHAQEWFSFNTIGSWVGKNTPIYLADYEGIGDDPGYPLTEQLKEESNPDAILLDGLEPAFIGITEHQPGRPCLAVYSAKKCLEKLEQEHFDQLVAKMTSEHAPVFLDDRHGDCYDRDPDYGAEKNEQEEETKQQETENEASGRAHPGQATEDTAEICSKTP